MYKKTRAETPYMKRILHRTMSTAKFGAFTLDTSQIFYESTDGLTRAFVNLKPIVPGHVLITPKRVVERCADMTREEIQDLWSAVHHIGPIIEKFHGCSALNIAIQDGKASGQSVPHVHVHVLPRKVGDFKRNDDIYEHLEKQDLQIHLHEHAAAKIEEGSENIAVDPAAERRPRTMQEMEAEANTLRELFPDNQPMGLKEI